MDPHHWCMGGDQDLITFPDLFFRNNSYLTNLLFPACNFFFSNLWQNKDFSQKKPLEIWNFISIYLSGTMNVVPMAFPAHTENKCWIVGELKVDVISLNKMFRQNYTKSYYKTMATLFSLSIIMSRSPCHSRFYLLFAFSLFD